MSSGVDSESVDDGEHMAVIQQHLHSADVVHFAVDDDDEMVVGTVVVDALRNNMRRFQPSPGVS